MSEKLNNNPEKSSEVNNDNEWESVSEVPFAGGRVEDVDKARAMAEDEDYHRTIAAEERKKAALKPGSESAARRIHRAERHEKWAAEAGDLAAKEYDETHNPDNSELIEDADKARVMAEAADEDMTEAARFNKTANDTNLASWGRYPAKMKARELRKLADDKAELAAKDYDAENK